jgi:hypothetical protein
VKLHTQGLQTLEQVRAFLDGSQPLEISIEGREQAYAFIAETLRRFRYRLRSRAEKGLLRHYLIKVTGLSRAQVTRLIERHQRGDEIRDRRGRPSKPFKRRYTDADVRALAELDALHETPSGPAARKLCERAYEHFGDPRYRRLAAISNGHLYNLRRSASYQRRRTRHDKTRPQHVAIGERRPPRAEGRPGFLRVDSVHQGELDGSKGLYHINLVDEVTQFQFIGSVPAISERYLVPLLEALIDAFPFQILGFHADNGSEYINHRVQAMLTKLQITEFTKCRARKSHDNALVESKNGSVLRKHLGYAHIPSGFVEAVNAFNQHQLSPYLNYHRPCFFPREEFDAKGRQRKRYRYADMTTPYEKLKSLPDAERYLRDGVTFEALDAIAYEISDNEAARRLKAARDQLFQTINRSQHSVA